MRRAMATRPRSATASTGEDPTVRALEEAAAEAVDRPRRSSSLRGRWGTRSPSTCTCAEAKRRSSTPTATSPTTRWADRGVDRRDGRLVRTWRANPQAAQLEARTAAASRTTPRERRSSRSKTRTWSRVEFARCRGDRTGPGVRASPGNHGASRRGGSSTPRRRSASPSRELAAPFDSVMFCFSKARGRRLPLRRPRRT